ncbi:MULTISPECIES: hypothetical protein [Streptomyces]|uniref:hypothetical protein n=1 Tax=Streptomyces TaxID=1883 RepID=UPI0016450D10|nr:MULTISPECIES: hypothetical protein [Streptomyces]MBT3077193.1 hypothetical protein [Streptomyces sp. COG21]MBT3082507.1 hypothetical protein [Streptomyces sp. COG20]MBT3100747.1 hypothetical protein [Streptomyces sp. CBG30]MBT3104483.1 hypothetical protein [Streptomyces sp. COG19]MBT3110784.1 hypothetical protein [Streptomyces sp. CYG20]
MGALMGLLLDPGLSGYTLAPDGPTTPGRTADVLVARHRRLPRDRMGHRLTASGRSLIGQALVTTYGPRAGVAPGALVRDAHRRWSVPSLGLNASVAHCGEFSAVAFAPAAHAIGVDVQDERDRPYALRWLGDLLARQEPATIRDFAECEALIKASHLTKETFAGTRLPEWRPGWRPMAERVETEGVTGGRSGTGTGAGAAMGTKPAPRSGTGTGTEAAPSSGTGTGTEAAPGARAPSASETAPPPPTPTYHVRSLVLRPEGAPPLHLALACDAPVPVRFHHLERE